MVYLCKKRSKHLNLNLSRFHLPDTVSSQTLTGDRLPQDWSRYPYPLSTQEIGSQWLNEGNSLIQFVPSVAVPAGLENIAVVNPRHPEIEQLKLASVECSLYNDRAFKGLSE